MYGIEWAAGLFEGEGCITTDTRQRVPRLKLSLRSTDQDVVQTFMDVVGGNVTGPYGPYDESSRKPIWAWHVTGIGSVKILQDLLPYLHDRRAQRAREYLAVVETTPKTKSEAAYLAWERRKAS